jgi:hypothetical protein
MKLSSLVKSGSNWFFAIPERALDKAYRAALKIKEIEGQHFQGNRVSSDSEEYGESVLAYFQNEVSGHIQTINMNLASFKTSRRFLNISNLANSSKSEEQAEWLDPTGKILAKLQFIDEVLERYQAEDSSSAKIVRPIVENKIEKNTPENPKEARRIVASIVKSNPQDRTPHKEKTNDKGKRESVSDKTGIIPRSFWRTLDRIKQEMDPKAEETEAAVLKNFRSSRYKTAISIKFILLLIIVPLLTYQLTKNFILTPIVKSYFASHGQIVFINQTLEKEALEDLESFERSLKLKRLLQSESSPAMSEEEVEKELKKKAQEITEDYRNQGVNAIANIVSDLLSLGAFAVIIVISRKEIEVVKTFLDEILYSLSDSAKAFLIILFTDMFVGFHSPHGWEVILESIARHFGLPENRDFNFLFIATFPVILDTILKYWIFRYLNRISPSAVATYRNMNE